MSAELTNKDYVSILKYYIEFGTNTVDFYDLTKAEYFQNVFYQMNMIPL